MPVERNQTQGDGQHFLIFTGQSPLVHDIFSFLSIYKIPYLEEASVAETIRL